MARAALRIGVTTKDRKVLQKLLSGGVQQVRVVLRALALLQLAKVDDPRLKPTTGTRQLRSNEPPTYPELARRLNIRGAVRLRVVVRSDGAVKEVHVLGGNPLLAQELSRAVMNWKYEPATQETSERVEYTFSE